MTHHGRRRLSRRDVEQLLSDPSSSRHALGPLLDAARSSQARIDPAREDAAAAAFVAATSAPAEPVSAQRRTRRPVLRALAATGLAVSLTTGGVALAASGQLPDVPLLRDLPGLPDRASDRATESVEKQTSRSASPTSPSTTESTGAGSTGSGSSGSEGTASGTAEPDGTVSETAKPGKPTSSTTSSPKPDLRGLCHAFQSPGSPGSSVGSAPFAVLVDAAGGRDKVEAFCVDLVGEPKPHKPGPSTKPEQPAPPSATPHSIPKPEDAGEPGTGKPEDAGKPEGAGAKREQVGKPASAGRGHAKR